MKIAVIGAGAWGTALALLAQRAGNSVTLWARSKLLINDMRARRVNAKYVPGVPIDSSIILTDDLALAAEQQQLIILAVPAQSTRAMLVDLAPHMSSGPPLLLTAKGIEISSGHLLSQVVEETLPGYPVAVLSGPTLAAEVAQKLPTAAVLACQDPAMGPTLIQAVGVPEFRPYLSHDMIGVQVGGAVKNVLAIAAGIITGRELGENARAALISRGLSELMALGMAMGGRVETFMGLAGCGDLILTCASTHSRNMALGMAMGQGIQPHQLQLTEGVFTAQALVQLSRRLNVTMPICTAIARILHAGATIDDEIHDLLARPFRREEFDAFTGGSVEVSVESAR